jgi:hypothetical protein
MMLMELRIERIRTFKCHISLFANWDTMLMLALWAKYNIRILLYRPTNIKLYIVQVAIAKRDERYDWMPIGCRLDAI